MENSIDTLTAQDAKLLATAIGYASGIMGLSICNKLYHEAVVFQETKQKFVKREVASEKIHPRQFQFSINRSDAKTDARAERC